MLTSNRRTLIKSLCLLGALGITGCDNADSDKMTERDARTYVLVHGAWHGGWCWRYVAEILRSQGHRVFTPTLTGLGERVHLNGRDVNLTVHTADIVNAIEFEDLEDVILVGHSYAGVIISLVADALKNKISHLVYLDAVLPENGQPFIPEEQHGGLRQAYGANYVLPVTDLDFLGIPADHDKADWVMKHLTPHPLETMFQTVRYENEGISGLPKTFIRCENTQAYKDGDSVKIMTREDSEWAYLTLATGHDAMVTEPGALAEMLLTLKS